MVRQLSILEPIAERGLQSAHRRLGQAAAVVADRFFPRLAAVPADLPQALVSLQRLLDSRPDVFDQLDVWIYSLQLEFDGAQWSDDSLPVSPVALAGWDRASLLMIDDSTERMDLSPLPLVIIRARLIASIIGDLDDDGDVDGADFLVWQRELGALSSEPASRAVPEPSTTPLALGALAVALGRPAGSIGAESPAGISVSGELDIVEYVTRIAS